LGECLAVEGPTTREVFEAYLERVLAPTLRLGRVVVVDNLSAHKLCRVCEPTIKASEQRPESSHGCQIDGHKVLVVLELDLPIIGSAL
jgi:hypothetical protein